MTAQGKIKDGDKVEALTGLDLLRAPFKPYQISKLPKPTRAQTDAVRDDYKKGVRCTVCGGWHHPKVVHLDYVGHAALTDRLLDCDPEWNWEPVATTEQGTPILDGNGGMWINLTVCNVTRLGYGHADGKSGGNAVKEVIGDALRNAAMRFGAALDLWHKGELHPTEDDDPECGGSDALKSGKKDTATTPTDREVEAAIIQLESAKTIDDLKEEWGQLNKHLLHVASDPRAIKAKEARKAALDAMKSPPPADDIDDEIPY